MGRWLAASGIAVAGTWAEGAAVLRGVDAAGGLELRAEEPWRFEKLRVVAAGEERAAGELVFRPELKRDGAGRWSGRVDKLRWAEAAGRGVEGALEGTWNEADGAYSGAVDLRAALPAGDPGPVEAGPLTVTLKAKAGSVAPKVGQVEELALVVSGADGELASLRSAGAWLYVRRPNGELLANSAGAWVLKTAALPLAWAGPYLPPGLEVAGDLQAFEGLLTTTLGVYQMRPLRLLSVRGLTVKQDGDILVNEADCSFYPGLDFRVAHALRPEFALAWDASAHATDGTVETRGRRALQFELAGGAVGDLEVALPKTIDVVLRGDVAALRALSPVAAARLPAAGRFVARADGDMLGTEPMRMWARVEDVPAPGGARMLAPLEAEARGKVDGRARVANFDVALRMGEGAAAGDLAFAVKFAPGEGTLRIDSTLRGRRWDLTETQAWAKALNGVEAPTAAAEEAAADAGAAPRVATSIGGPVWGPLRGSFELELGELLLAPYRVEKLRGRAELDERALTVTGLGGEMFSGRLSGDLVLRHEPGAEGGDHALKADFSIQQFDTARVVQEVFPNEFGMLDAKVDLRAAVKGRGFRLWDLTERAEADFTVEGKGVARLTHPDARTASTLLVMGGVFTLSPELRALGRLLRKFAEMPVDDLRIEGGRSADGALHLSRVRLDSPQARLEGTGEVAAAEGVALPARPLRLRLGLRARDETGLILGRMRLLEKGADAEGYRRVAGAVEVRGEAGRPDASELYDLLARGAAGSRGTWGLIMRRVQREVERQQAKEAREAGATKPKQPEEAEKQT
jgi:hypothetical protein